MIDLLLRLAILLSVLCATQGAYAFKDPLNLPAIQAHKAAQALTLHVTSHGSDVLMVGEHGIVLKRYLNPLDSVPSVTDKEGKKWLQAKVPVSVNLTSVFFANAKLAFAVGHDGVILKSVDAGYTWAKVFDGVQANQQVLAAARKKMDEVQARLDFFQSGLPLKTAQQSKLRDMEVELETAQFAFEDAQAGAKFGPARPLLDVWFKDAQVGWVVGSYGLIFETRDGGSNWTLIADRLDNPDFRHYNSVYGDQTGLLIIAGEAGRIYRSTDFGQSWLRLDTGYNGHLYGTALLRNEAGQTIVFAYGFGGNVYRLAHGTDNWKHLKSPSKESFVHGLTLGKKILLVDQKGRLVSIDESGSAIKVEASGEGQLVTGMARVDDSLVLSGQHGPRTLALPRHLE